MRERVEALLGDDTNGIWLSTFHSLCARLLRREAPHIGLSRDFVIYDSSDQVAVVKQVEKELAIDDKLVPPRVALSRISQAKNRMEGPDALRSAWNLRDEQIAKIYERYLTALRDANALDFDDLLLKTVELFDTSEQVRERYSRKFKYVMVDEYQDTNRPQYLLIRHLAGAHRNVAVVGDPDQSIYKWRGADLRNILDFETDFGEAKIVRLEQNYRSRRSSDAATAVIQKNRNQATSGCGPPERRRQDRHISGAATSSRRPISSSDRSSTRGWTTWTRWRPCSIARTRSRARSKIS
jgi:DNA helicase-2/ATP-dependent DNA helicase PcrA